MVAFEANPHNYRLCKDRFNYDKLGVEYIHSAVASEPGDLTFKVQMIENGEKINKATGRSSIFQRRDAKYGFETVTVPGTSLDSFFTPKPSNCVLWIDVEGAAELVLKGGRGLLEAASMVYIEVEDKALWEGQWLTRDITRFLHGYEMLPVARDFESQSRVQYNLIFMKKHLRSNRLVWRYFSEFYSEAGAGRAPAHASKMDTA